jgi:hypothetical protein
MIDYILKYANEAAAKTALASRLNAGEWPTDYFLPGITIWRDSQDVPDGQGGFIHTPLTGFFILVSLPNVLPALRDLAAVQVVVDRDLAKARQPGAVIKSNVTNAILQDLRWSPILAGSDNPWGTWA